MAKKDKPQAPPGVELHKITKGGSYVVDPATGGVERVAFTERRPADLSATSQLKSAGQADDAPAAAQPE